MVYLLHLGCNSLILFYLGGREVYELKIRAKLLSSLNIKHFIQPVVIASSRLAFAVSLSL